MRKVRFCSSFKSNAFTNEKYEEFYIFQTLLLRFESHESWIDSSERKFLDIFYSKYEGLIKEQKVANKFTCW